MTKESDRIFYFQLTSRLRKLRISAQKSAFTMNQEYSVDRLTVVAPDTSSPLTTCHSGRNNSHEKFLLGPGLSIELLR